MNTTVLVAGEHRIIRDGLRSLLKNEPDMEVVAEAEGADNTILLTKQYSPDIAIIEIGQTRSDGIETTRQISSQVPGTKVLALSMSSNNGDSLRDMLRAGARGYVTKDCGGDELIVAMHHLIEGKTYFSATVVDAVFNTYVNHIQQDKKNQEVALSDRESEVIRLLTGGHSTKQIALQLQISDKTIDACRRHIMDKLGMHSIPELTKYAIREGLTSVED
ncbi:MAG: response regulator transcription factor [Phycisphaerae bacterium]